MAISSPIPGRKQSLPAFHISFRHGIFLQNSYSKMQISKKYEHLEQQSRLVRIHVWAFPVSLLVNNVSHILLILSAFLDLMSTSAEPSGDYSSMLMHLQRPYAIQSAGLSVAWLQSQSSLKGASTVSFKPLSMTVMR